MNSILRESKPVPIMDGGGIDENGIFRGEDIGCLECREVVSPFVGMATPIRMYVAALVCPQCDQEFCKWEV